MSAPDVEGLRDFFREYGYTVEAAQDLYPGSWIVRCGASGALLGRIRDDGTYLEVRGVPAVKALLDVWGAR